MTTVTMRHLRSLGYCSRGARAWCERYGFDWLELVERGLPAEAVEATGDHYGLQAAAIARAEASEGAAHG